MTPLHFLMHQGDLRLFALNTSRDFGAQVSEKLAISLSQHEERDFEDGEHKARPLVNVRGQDVFVIQSLYSDTQHSVNDKLCRLLFFLGALRDASAARLTAVVPYLCYARKDRKSQPRDPVTTRYVATLFEAMGVDRVLTLDVHNLAAFQNAFRCHTDHLEAKNLFIDYFMPLVRQKEVVVVVAGCWGDQACRGLSADPQHCPGPGHSQCLYGKISTWRRGERRGDGWRCGPAHGDYHRRSGQQWHHTGTRRRGLSRWRRRGGLCRRLTRGLCRQSERSPGACRPWKKW